MTIRKKVFKLFWMTTDENFKIVKEIETENSKKELIKKEKEKIKTEAVTKATKEKAAIKRKAKKNVGKKNKIKPQAVNCVAWNFYQLTARSVKMKIFAQRSLGRNQNRLGTIKNGVSCD